MHKKQINHRVKIIRCDNGTEFKSSEMNQFCQMKGIERKFSVARTPQQNRVAERKNKTLIEAASKAFRVFNSRTKRVEENFHIKFLENKPNVVERGPEWLFNIDLLIKSMNYEPITARNQTNNDAGIEIHDDAGQAGQKRASDHEYILIPFMPSNSPLDVDEVPDKGDEGVSKGSGIDDQEKTDSSTQDINTAKPSINTANTNINTGSLNINIVGSNDPSMPSLEETSIFYDVYDDREVGTEADTNNLEF
nr:putative ribonuclease H-like domain-containing protein [Tanacetum cinerariifolium]